MTDELERRRRLRASSTSGSVEEAAARFRQRIADRVAQRAEAQREVELVRELEEEANRTDAAVTLTLVKQRTFTVEASSKADAIERVKDGYGDETTRYPHARLRVLTASAEAL